MQRSESKQLEGGGHHALREELVWGILGSRCLSDGSEYVR